MEDIQSYYQTKCKEWEQEIAQLSHQIWIVGTIRLVLVVMAAIGVYLGWNAGWKVWTGILLLCAIPFIYLMMRHDKLFYKRSYTEVKRTLAEQELQGLAGDYSAFDGADEERNADHSFTLDLDVFGPKSLFQLVNRTVTYEGRKQLARWFKKPLDVPAIIQQRQEAIRELATRPDLFFHFYALGRMKSAAMADTSGMKQLVQEPSALGSCAWKLFFWVVPVGWLLLIVGNGMGSIPEIWIGPYLIVSLVIAYAKAGEVNRLYASVDKLEQSLATHAELLKCLEETPFQAESLQRTQAQWKRNGRQASASLRTLSRHIGALNQRFSLAGVILNVLFLRDMRHALALEAWKTRHREDIGRWMEALGEMDAFCSAGHFAFTHPDYIYPTFTEAYFQMRGKSLGHPLLDRKVCVRNDVTIPHHPWFLIITGANMAGKSTYLRTIGVNYLLACMGLPVCAQELTLYPAHLVTSLRTSDSLTSNESYFFAELKRLKMIIDRLQQGEKLFIILDEILKGTNSLDKQKGSMALMKQLVAYETCGIIATHDLVLGELEKEFPQQIKNYCFEADIHDDELTFSYRLREGIAQNMNACFLMQKMGITVSRT